MMKKIDLLELTRDITDEWKNFPVAKVNNHEVRISVLQTDFHWHTHEDTDECFYVIQGRLNVDFENKTEVLGPGELITVPKGVKHRTRADMRTLTLCFEAGQTDVTGGIAPDAKTVTQ